ncbi:bifunctional diaminohydroxyphosphoribosylaminopyrimidine deaminase/5-amino-6-(5-phosphoribosylamino)uracil reductase RibD [Phenylobacterium sp.]|uniref:bifunctional diaminohydroxyphosphoribosylaminopyrimidine deaminase/5-amino-6-(5-phosphoribosylamino)uracil reductase RibD n=1 Tax=Phenylobacterium sp. TaxID=1871053 RepID=UPI00286A1893|nr:bifunctional diaminohydroxyphosphoribosylaminopyrimidine deaminase/5-amino-6-(5-phosphoribosylamino)uracil reductase RibD [Phenylobacterium sp.]
MSATDQDHMRRAIDLARSNLGLTSPNPSVGCVIVRAGQVVGEGATSAGGRPHAEEQALEQAGQAAHGATAYVTLEPCAARSSGGPSCSERLVAAGVARVLIACEDPSAFAAGKGAERLAAAGIDVQLGLCADEAQALYVEYRPATIHPNRLK